jgi:mycothiol synthase
MPDQHVQQYGVTMHRSYRDEHDLTLLLGWLSAHAHTAYMHPADLVWWLRQNTLVDPTTALELFFSEPGQLQGFVFLDTAFWAVLQGVPGLPDSIWDDMVASVVARTDGAAVIQPHEWDTAQVEALMRAGFAPTANRMLRLVHTAEPSDQEPVLLPADFRFADMARHEVSAEARVGLHQAVWHPSKVTLEAYERLQRAPLYRPDLDVMVVAPSGELACYALGWYDPGSRMGLMEPVGTREPYRRQGLGHRLIREVTRRQVVLGAQRVTIGTYEKNQAAVGLYQGAGYRLDGHWMDFKRAPSAEQ